MGNYQDDMSEEKKPASLLPEGLRTVRIIEMIKGVSKAGNNQFVTTIEDIKTRETMPIWLVAEPKKRWMLKNLLDVCNVPKNSEGKHDWSETDVIGKVVVANIKHYTEPWVNREGNEIQIPKCKVSEFLLPDENESKEKHNGKDIAWEE